MTTCSRITAAILLGLAGMGGDLCAEAEGPVVLSIGDAAARAGTPQLLPVRVQGPAHVTGITGRVRYDSRFLDIRAADRTPLTQNWILDTAREPGQPESVFAFDLFSLGGSIDAAPGEALLRLDVLVSGLLPPEGSTLLYFEDASVETNPGRADLLLDPGRISLGPQVPRSDLLVRLPVLAGEPGQRISIPVEFTEIHDISGIELQMAWDKNLLTFVTARSTSLYNALVAPNARDGVLNLGAAAFDGIEAFGPGALLEIVMDVRPGLPPGSATGLDLRAVRITNGAPAPLPLLNYTLGGEIVVPGGSACDVSRDRSVSEDDLFLLLRHYGETIRTGLP